MSRSGGNLKPAHRGYRYQDIVSAYFLVLALVDRYDSVTIDEKQVEDDRFDDIEVSIAGNRIRRQIKSSTDVTRCINTGDFTGANSSLRIDRLILTARQEPDVAEYRLCATWHPPEQADALSGLITPVAREPSIGGTRTQCFQLIPELIWPEGGSQVWAQLANPSAGITHEEFAGYCSRFLIELELPSASTDLTAPGIIENAVIGLLADRVGVGRYPNQSRLPSDVAALAVSLATLARTDWPNLSTSDIEKSLELRLDFGRVAQSFPVDRARFYDRPSFRVSLRANIQGGGIHLVLAPPGSGKSWELTRLGEELANDEQAIVARHYCYLEPGDDQVERRITSDVFFGNLIAELFEAAPALNDFPHYYSADLTTLENTLQNVTLLDKPIVLIVDGLDHIARVLASSSSLSDDETDIVEQLATLSLPQGVSLVLGSQPGVHLEVLHGSQSIVTEHQLPPWSSEDTIGLTKVLTVPQAMEAAGFTDDAEVTETLETLAERADGNPLYARYLSDGLIVGMQVGRVDSPNDWLRSNPEIEGNIATYYQHLYANISNEAKEIADIFGTIDFSISEDDLRQILPPLTHRWIPQALNALSPILNRSTAQGGMRVFHESFRRFMLDEFARQGQQLNDILGPVISWLTQRGFFSDAKSYRFLLPLLRRAGQNAELLDWVGTSFVSKSVTHAHPAEATGDQPLRHLRLRRFHHRAAGPVARRGQPQRPCLVVLRAWRAGHALDQRPLRRRWGYPGYVGSRARFQFLVGLSRHHHCHGLCGVLSGWCARPPLSAASPARAEPTGFVGADLLNRVRAPGFRAGLHLHRYRARRHLGRPVLGPLLGLGSQRERSPVAGIVDHASAARPPGRHGGEDRGGRRLRDKPGRRHAGMVRHQPLRGWPTRLWFHRGNRGVAPGLHFHRDTVPRLGPRRDRNAQTARACLNLPRPASSQYPPSKNMLLRSTGLLRTGARCDRETPAGPSKPLLSSRTKTGRRSQGIQNINIILLLIKNIVLVQFLLMFAPET